MARREICLRGGHPITAFRGKPAKIGRAEGAVHRHGDVVDGLSHELELPRPDLGGGDAPHQTESSISTKTGRRLETTGAANPFTRATPRAFAISGPTRQPDPRHRVQHPPAQLGAAGLAAGPNRLFQRRARLERDLVGGTAGKLGDRGRDAFGATVAGLTWPGALATLPSGVRESLSRTAQSGLGPSGHGEWALERSSRPSAAGLIIGVAAAIKLFPIYLVVYYVAQGRIRPLLATATSFLTVTVITALVLGLDSYDDYIQVVLPWNSQFRIIGYNLSIAGLWHKLFYPVPGERIIPVWSSLALCAMGNLVVESRRLGHRGHAGLPGQDRRGARPGFRDNRSGDAPGLTGDLDAALPILLAPFALIARSAFIAGSRRLTASLIVILVINWIPQQDLTRLALAGRSIRDYSWTFVLGFPSLKFYALLGTFLLGLAACWFEAAKREQSAAVGVT